MKQVFILILSLLSSSVFAGSLYSFDKDAVLFQALSHIQLRYSDLAKFELKPIRLQPSIDKSGRLVVAATFSYPANNEFGLLYVCSKVDENGGLKNIKRDIGARKGIAGFPLPETQGCWGKS